MGMGLVSDGVGQGGRGAYPNAGRVSRVCFQNGQPYEEESLGDLPVKVHPLTFTVFL